LENPSSCRAVAEGDEKNGCQNWGVAEWGPNAHSGNKKQREKDTHARDKEAVVFWVGEMSKTVTCNACDRFSVQTDGRMDGLYFLPHVSKFGGVISEFWYIGGYIT